MKNFTQLKWLACFLCLSFNHIVSAQTAISGRNLMVNGSVYQIRGICYNPVPLGSGAGQVSYAQIDKDISLMKDACINTVRTYSPNMGQAELDKLNNAGIKVIIGFWITDIQNGTYINYINQYKNHPAILMWGLGNEFNYHAGDMFGGNINNWYTMLNNAAGSARNADPNHPAATIHGELPEKSVIDACPNVQVWGLNVYRGDNPGPLFTDFAARSGKPMFLGETGADSYPDANAPGKAIPLIWGHVYDAITTSAGGICAGACFFEWTDEWWKSGNNNVQDAGGFPNGGAPYDGFANEEYWGVLDVNRNPKGGYNALKTAFCKNVRPAATKGLVTIFEDIDYTGYSTGLSLGDYNLADLKALGMADNSLTSVSLVEGYKAILYFNDNFTGTAMTVTADQTWIGTQFNDQVTSIRILPNGLTNVAGKYLLQNRNSGLYMDVAGSGTADGINIAQANFSGNTNQQFQFTHLGDGVYKILAVHSGKSVDIDAVKTTDGANVQQWVYLGSANQKFIVVSTGDGFYKIIPSHSGKVVEVAGAGMASGNNIQQWKNNDQTCGQWKFKPLAATGTGTGLKGNYFNGMDFETPVFSRTDAGINFDWKNGSPDVSVNADKSSVRWTGQVQPRYDGEYTFYINSDNGRRLWVNDQLIIDKWLDDVSEYSGKITLAANQKYEIKIEYFENSGGAACKMEWASFMQDREVVPAMQLYPNALPSVNITAPTNNQSFMALANINIATTAADTDGSIAKVEFYNGATKLGEVTSSPFTYSWANVTQGSYTIKAIVSDNRGGVTVSAPVNVAVSVATGIQDAKSATGISIYPNPADHILYITADFDISESSIKIFDPFGKAIHVPIAHKNQIDLHAVHPGIYLIEITHNDQKFTQKFIKK